MQQRLLMSAIGLTLVVGAFLFVLDDNVFAQTQNDRQSPTPTASVLSSTSPVVSPSTTPDEDEEATPVPQVSPVYRSLGKVENIEQRFWKKAKASTNPAVIGKERKKSTKQEDDESDYTALDFVSDIAPPVSAGRYFFSLFGGGNENDLQCIGDDEKIAYQWMQYMTKKGITFNNDKGAIVGGKGKKIAENYLISNVFTSQRGDAAEWRNISMITQSSRSKAYKLYYRVSDEGGTNDANDAGWVELKKPNFKDSPCHKGQKKAVYNLKATGKYFQYKVHILGTKENVGKIQFKMQPLKQTNGSGVTPVPSPSVSATPATDTGKLTITTKKLIAQKKSATPDPSSGVLLPPSPVTSAKPSPSNEPHPACFSNKDTEPAANVPIRLRQVDGETKIEDEQTDEDGIWQGLNGNRDDIPVGTYILNWGDYENEDYKLVDICVSPNDGSMVRRTETSVTGGNQRATILIKKSIETKITLLYALRDKPYITMNKFAIDAKGKVIRTIIPGTRFRYAIRYENTGDADAKEVAIKDLFAEQFTVLGANNQTLDSIKDVQVERDAFGRTQVTKKIGTLKKGEKGTLVIPVLLRADAFGSVQDIADLAASQSNPDTAPVQSTQTAGSPAAE